MFSTLDQNITDNRLTGMTDIDIEHIFGKKRGDLIGFRSEWNSFLKRKPIETIEVESEESDDGEDTACEEYTLYTDIRNSFVSIYLNSSI